MIYRIDLQHFLIHAIDHFSLQDLTEMQYCIISAKIPNGGKARNVTKMNDLYPSPDTVIAYAETHDKSVLKKMYIDTMFPKHKKGEPETSTFTNLIYQTFINTLLQRQNVMIVCDELENPYIDCLCDYLKDEYGIEVIDLNELFTKGRIGPIYIDRDDIKDKAVDIRRAALRDQVKALASTKDGKAKLIEKMSKKKKLKELEKFGVKADKDDDVDSMLLEEWCREDGQWDED